MGPDLTKASSYSLPRTRRRVVARWYALDLLTLPFLSAGESVEPRVSRQVHRWIKAILPTKQARVSWSLRPLGAGEGVRGLPAHLVPAGVGRVRQAPVWWTRARSAVPGSLHSSRRDLQPSIALGRQQPSVLRSKDYAHHNKRRTLTLSHEEFLRRFLQHVLPKGFPRIRYFGWLANRRRGRLLPICRDRLACQPPAPPTVADGEATTWRCPRCHGPMRIIERLTAFEIRREENREIYAFDSS